MAQSRKNSKSLIAVEGIKRSSKESTPDINNGPLISAPKYGTVIPDRVFVGGISSNTLPSELTEFFSKYGKVIDAKIISDRAGVSKGYGFVTFASNEEVHQLLEDVRTRDIMLRERKLNIAPAIKKQVSGGNKMYPSFAQRLEASNNGANSVASSPLFPGAGIAYGPTFHNGMAYYSAPQAQPQPPPAPPHHLDPGLFTGYPVPAAPAQYQPLFHQPIYFQQPQYAPQYPVSFDGTDGSGMMDSTQLVVGGYYLPEAVTGQPLFAAPAPPEYAQQYLPQPQYPQYTPASAHEQPMLPVSPRRYYDQLLVPEQGRGEKEEERKSAMAVVPVAPSMMSKPMNNNNIEQTNRNLQPHPNPISSSSQVQPYPVYQARGPPTYQQTSPVTHHAANSAAVSNQGYRRPKPNYYQSWRGHDGASYKSRHPGENKWFSSRPNYLPTRTNMYRCYTLDDQLNQAPHGGSLIVNSSLSMQGGGSGGSVGSGGGGMRRNGKRYPGTAGSVSSYGSGGGGPSPLSTPRSSDPTPSSAPSTPPSNQQQQAAVSQPAAPGAPQEALVQQMQALTA